jgi:alpha-amylase
VLCGQRGEACLTYKDGPLYLLANVFMLAHPYGYPKASPPFAAPPRPTGPGSPLT